MPSGPTRCRSADASPSSTCSPGGSTTASTKLAALVLSTQLGLQSIPKEAAVKAMNALEEVIEGLKSLKTYRI